MKRRLAALAISLVVSAGLVHASVQPASACACMPGPDLNNMQNTFDHVDLVVEGHLAASEPGDHGWSRRFAVDTVYDGDSPPQIVLALREPSVIDPAFDSAGYLDTTAPDCTYIILGQTDDRYVLFPRPDSTGAYEPLGCVSFAIQDEARDSYYRDLHSAIQNAALAHPPDATLVTPTIAPVLPVIPAKWTPLPSSNSRPPSEYLRAVQKTAGTVTPGGNPRAPSPPCLRIVATPPPGAQLGLDCNWHLPDGSVIPAIGDGVQQITPQTSEASVNDKDVPWQILLPLAFIIPLAVLLIFSRIKPRGGGP